MNILEIHPGQPGNAEKEKQSGAENRESKGGQRFVEQGKKMSELNNYFQKHAGNGQGMTNNNSTNRGKRKNKKRNPEVAIVEKGDASDGTLYDAEAAIHLTAAFA